MDQSKQSLSKQTAISHEEMEARMQEVQALASKERERYSMVKDTYTGEHYVRYTQHHLNLMEGGVEEVYDYLLPVDTDDVLSIVLGEQEYDYPKQWGHSYLRGSHVDAYIWFDPSTLEGVEDEEQVARELSDMLDGFRVQGKFDDDAIRELFKRIDEKLDHE